MLAQTRRRPYVPKLELLEDRTAPAVFNIAPGDNAAFITAVQIANTNDEADTINLATNGTYEFSTPDNADNALPVVLLDNANPANTLTINGNGATLRRSGATNMRFLEIATGATLSLENLTFANGRVNGDGGAILSAGDLTVILSRFENNSAIGGNGGAIHASNGEITATHNHYFLNTATEVAASGGFGGAIHLDSVTTGSIRNSTFTRNQGDSVSAVSLDASVANLVNNTLVNNTGSSALGISGGTATIHNNLVARNAAGAVTGTVAAGTNNLIDDATGLTGITDSVDGNIIGPISDSELGIGAFRNNGGLSNTFALLPTSVALDAGNNVPVTDSADQRSVTRISNGTVDIGAFELQQPLEITISTGDSQSTIIGTTFAENLAVEVTEANSTPLVGAAVTFTPPAAGASASVSSSAITNAGGIASTSATANANTGSYVVTASLNGTALSEDFDLTNTAGVVLTVSAKAGDGQNATVNTDFATDLSAFVVDQFGNPVGGVDVTFEAPATGASGTFGGSTVVSTNIDGIATAPTFMANTTAGSYVVTAAANGPMAEFDLTNTADVPDTISITNGNDQSATVNMDFANPLVVTVFDQFANPVPNVDITFTPPSTGAGGTFALSNTVTTDVNGVATANTFTANTVAGSYQVAAQATGGSNPSTNFDLTNIAGAPDAVVAVAGTPQSTIVNTTFPTNLQALVTDEFDNPIENVNVAFVTTASSGGTFGGGAIVPTNGSGVAEAPPIQAGSGTGTINIEASVPGVADTALFILTVEAGAAESAEILVGDGQTTEIETNFAILLQVAVRDANSNLVPGVPVTFSVNAGSNGAGADFTGATTINTNSNGVAIASNLEANGISGTFTVTAQVNDGANPSVVFQLENEPGEATSVNVQGTTIINKNGRALFSLTASDKNGNPVKEGTALNILPKPGPNGATINFDNNVVIVGPGGVGQAIGRAVIASGPSSFDVVTPNNVSTTVNLLITPPASVVVVGADAGASPHVVVIDPRLGSPNDRASIRFSFFAFDPNFTGGVRVATGDVNGDGIDDIIVGAGPGGGPHIRVFDGDTGAMIRDFFAFNPSFNGGVYVTAGDVNRDGVADIIVSADAGGGPHVKAFDGATGAVIADFFAYAPTFNGGVRVAAGDVDGDGHQEIITVPGPGGGPHVKVYSGATLHLLKEFLAYDPTNTGGLFVAAGDTNGDFLAEIVVSTLITSPTRFFNGLTGALSGEFLAFDPAPVFASLSPFNIQSLGPVRVATVDLDPNRPGSEILTSLGPGRPPDVRGFDATTLTALDGFFESFVPFPLGFTGGVFLGDS